MDNQSNAKSDATNSREEVTLEFKDGTIVKGVIIAEALCVLILKVDRYFYLVNRFKLKDED